MSDDQPVWEQRMRVPQLLSFSLLGPPVSWARDHADRGVLLSTLGGRVEVFAFDASSTPATLTKVTERPQGTLGAAISPDASSVYWFDDSSGDEVGRWVRHDVATGREVTLLPDLDPTYSAGIKPQPSGAVLGRQVDSGFELAVVGGSGAGNVVYSLDEPADLLDVSSDQSRALVAFAPGGDWLHLGLRVIDLADGAVVAELIRRGKNLEGIGFSPTDQRKVLLTHEPYDRSVPALWRTDAGELDDIDVSISGDVSAKWYPDGRSLLLVVLNDARHSVHSLALESKLLTTLREADGVVHAASARPDGSVHLLHSRSDRPVSLGRVTNGDVDEFVRLPGQRPPPSVLAQDVRATGPGGQVHALLQLPPSGKQPYPTLFVPHGGPTAQDFDGWNDATAAYLDHGYAVVRVNYRGSTGYGAAWRDALKRDIGYIEMEDITAIRDVLESRGIIDPERTSITGGSWGGYLSLMAVSLQPGRWRSAAALVPVADWFTMTEDSPPFMQAYDRSLFGADIAEEPDWYRAASPISYVDDVVAPLFITAGENDPRCPVRQIDLYVEAVRERGGDVRYDRLSTGHGLFDIDVRVHEVGRVLDFLTSTNPV